MRQQPINELLNETQVQLEQANIERKLGILKRAMEAGANVSFSIYRGGSKKEAAELGEQIGVVEMSTTDNGGWYSYGGVIGELTGSIHYVLSKEEEIAKLKEEIKKAEEELCEITQ